MRGSSDADTLTFRPRGGAGGGWRGFGRCEPGGATRGSALAGASARGRGGSPSSGAGVADGTRFPDRRRSPMSEVSSGHAGSDDAPGPEVRKIRHLVRLMHKYDLTAIDIQEGESHIRLRRRNPDAVAHAAPAAVPMAIPAAAPVPAAAAAAPAAASAPAPAAAAPAGIYIESPTVGTFYASSAPGAEPFAQVGTVVRENTTVGIIEAMKVFTEIPAGVSGKIVEVLVKDKEPVEFGQRLFRVEPA